MHGTQPDTFYMGLVDRWPLLVLFIWGRWANSHFVKHRFSGDVSQRKQVCKLLLRLQ